MRIPHGHSDRRMTENALQCKNAASIHHEVACEGMLQDVCALSLG